MLGVKYLNTLRLVYSVKWWSGMVKLVGNGSNNGSETTDLYIFFYWATGPHTKRFSWPKLADMPGVLPVHSLVCLV